MTFIILIIGWLIAFLSSILGLFLIENNYNKIDKEYFYMIISNNQYNIEELSDIKNDNDLHNIEIVIDNENNIVYVIDKVINKHGINFTEEDSYQIIKGYDCRIPYNEDKLILNDKTYEIKGSSREGKSYINDYAIRNIGNFNIFKIYIKGNDIDNKELDESITKIFIDSIIIPPEKFEINEVLNITDNFLGLLLFMIGLLGIISINLFAYFKHKKLNLLLMLLGTPKKTLFYRELIENLTIKSTIYIVSYIIAFCISRRLALEVNYSVWSFVYFTFLLLLEIVYNLRFFLRRKIYDSYKEWI